MKYMFRIIGIILISILILTGCSKDKNYNPDLGSITLAPTPTIVEANQDTENVSNETKATTEVVETIESSDAIAIDVNYDPSFKKVFEAEDAVFTGNVKVESSKTGFTGTGYLSGIQSDTDTVTFAITVPGTGSYDLNFISAGNTGHKENNILVDGVNIGLSIVDKDDFQDSILEQVYLTAGEHKIMMTKSWGWILLDSLIVTASAPADLSIYDVSSDLVDAQATDGTKRLMQYLTDMYGNHIISGQYGDLGILGPEFTAIKNATGEYPAILGLDFIEYTPSRVANGSVGMDVQYAKKFHEEGGIVTFCWHWNAPEPYLINSGDLPWWKGFYTEASTIDLKKIMDGEDQKGYDLLLRDIDTIAEQMKILQKADIPILWRPLHEASGGWFWWGASGSEAYIKLYRLLYDRLTNYHGIHNLIWVWNGQNKDWYPGDDVVDIVGTDVYPGERVYNSQNGKFNELVGWLGDTKKLITMSENGCIFDPDLAVRDNAMWSYFGTWEGEFITLNNSYSLSEKYTETSMLKKAYTSDKVITLDELPDLLTYGN